MKPELSVKNLTKIFGEGCRSCLDPDFVLNDTNSCPDCQSVIACKNISFDLYPNEVLGIVGESGSGKSTLMRLLFFDIEPTYGEMYMNVDYIKKKTSLQLDDALFRSIEGINLFTLNSFRKRQIRNFLLGIVYQHPHIGLKLDISSGGNIAERLLMAGFRNIEVMRSTGKKLLQKTEVPLNRIDDPPRVFSGGMQQRVQIAKALSNGPALLLLDEVTTGLDLSVQARVLDLIRNLIRELRLSVIAVSHDLGVIRLLTQRSMVMKNGLIIEQGLTDQILEDPQHAYTQLLVNSALTL
jgi:putative phosphonate transport system ATP-binding protein